MKHGIHIPAADRDHIALRALEISRTSASRAEALRKIASEFDVSEPTARNLIGRGRWLQGFVLISALRR